MAEPRGKCGQFEIHVDSVFDRLRESKLVQAYNLLVPCRERPVGRRKECEGADGSDLRTGIVRTAARGEHDRQQTASLKEFARQHELEVPEEWVLEDEGFSGATLERPGLERVRDLAAEGQIQVVLAYSPDRLSRKYAYQIFADGGAGPPRSGNALCEGSAGRQRRGPTAGAVPGYDCRV